MTHPAYAHLDPRDDALGKTIAVLVASPMVDTATKRKLSNLQSKRVADFDQAMAALDRIADGK